MDHQDQKDKKDKQADLELWEKAEPGTLDSGIALFDDIEEVEEVFETIDNLDSSSLERIDLGDEEDLLRDLEFRLEESFPVNAAINHAEKTAIDPPADETSMIVRKRAIDTVEVPILQISLGPAEAVEPADEGLIEGVEAVEPADEGLIEGVEAVEPAGEGLIEGVEAVEPADEGLIEGVEAVAPADEGLIEGVEPVDEEPAEPVEPADEGLIEGVEPVEPADEGLIEGVEPVEPADEGLIEGVEPVEPVDEEMLDSAVVELAEVEMAEVEAIEVEPVAEEPVAPPPPPPPVKEAVEPPPRPVATPHDPRIENGLDDSKASALIRSYRMELAGEGEGDSPRSAMLSFEIGELFREEIQDPTRAMMSYREAFLKNPAFSSNLEAVGRLFRQQKDWKAAGRFMDEEIKIADPPALRAALLKERAQLALYHLDNEEGAIEDLERALEVDSMDLGALLQLEEIYLRQADEEALLSLYERLAEVVPDRELAAAYLVEAARLRQGMGDEEQAVGHLRSALTASPNNLPALEGLISLHDIRGEGEERVAALDRVAEILGQGEEAALALLDGAEELSFRLNRPEEAVERHSRLAALAGGQPWALESQAAFHASLLDWNAVATDLKSLGEGLDDPREKALAFFDAGLILSSLCRAPDEAAIHFAQAAALAPKVRAPSWMLEEHYLGAQRWSDLAELLISDSGASEDRDMRSLRLFEAGELFETRIIDVERAAGLFAESLELRPDFIPALMALSRVAGRMADPSSQMERLEASLERLALPSLKLLLYEDLAALWQGKLQSVERAEKAWLAVLEMEPGHSVALSSLRALSLRAGRWHQAIRMNEQMASSLADPALAAFLWRESGHIWESKLFKPEEAMACYITVLDGLPLDPVAFRAMARTYHRQGRWEDLASLLRRVAAGIDEPEEKVKDLYRIGQIYDDKMWRKEEAIVAYRATLDAVPQYLPCLESLDRLYEIQRQWEDVIEIREALAESSPDETVKAALHLEVGEIWEEHLDREGDGAASYETAVLVKADDKASLLALEGLYRRTGELNKLASTLERRLEGVTEAGESKRLALSLADLLAHEILETDQALEVYQKVLALEPTNIDALQGMERIYRERGQWDSLIELYSRWSTEETDPVLLVPLHLEAAGIRSERMNQPAAAAEHYRLALELDEGNLYASQALIRLCLDSQDWKGLAGLLEPMAQGAEGEEKAALLAWLGEMRERVGEWVLAREAFSESLLVVPDQISSLQGMRRLAHRQGDKDELASMTQRLGETLRDRSRACRALLGAGEIWWRDLGQEDRALVNFNQVVRLAPSHEKGNMALQDLLRQREDWAELARVIDKRIRQTKDKETLIALYLEQGEIYYRHLGQRLNATACMRKILGLEPDHLGAQLALGEILRDGGQIPQAARALESVIRGAKDPMLLMKAYLNLGLLHVENLSQPHKGFELLRKALTCAGGDHASARMILDRLIALAEEMALWRKAVAALRLSDLVVEDPGDRVEIAVKVARLYEEKLGNQNRAASFLAQAVRSQPERFDVMEHLVELYTRTGQNDARGEMVDRLAIHLEQGLAQDMWNLTLRHQYRKVQEWKANNDRLLWNSLFLDYLRDADEFEARVVQEFASEPPAWPERPLAEADGALLMGEGVYNGPLRPILSLLCEPLARIFPFDLGRYGLQKGDKLSTRNDSPIRPLYQNAARAMGDPDFDIYLCNPQPGVVTVDGGHPSVLILGAQVAQEGESLKNRFLVGRCLWRLREGMTSVHRLPDADLVAALVAAVRLHAPTFPDHGVAPDRLQEMGRLISKALSRKANKALADLAKAQDAAGPLPDISSWREAEEMVANRAGLLLCGSLDAALDALRDIPESRRAGQTPQEIVADLKEDHRAIALITFSLSDAFMDMRKALGLASSLGV